MHSYIYLLMGEMWMDYLFRGFREEDLDEAKVLFEELGKEAAEVSFADVTSKEEILEWIKDPNCRLYSAIYENRLIAVFRGRVGMDDKRHSALLTVAVDKKMRGRHVAKQFTLFCLEDLKRNGVSLARAYVYSNNPSSINTLLTCGFTVSGCVYQHHFNESTGCYIDDMIFHKIL